MQAHDHPELRAKVRAELLYPVKRQESRPVTPAQLGAAAWFYWHRGWSITGLSESFGIPEEVLRDVCEGCDAAAS
jgi:hypothetical protein